VPRATPGVADFFEWAGVVACLLIIAEWSYVILWTRRFGKVVTGGVLRAVSGLRTGRGKNPTAAETLAAASEAPPASPPAAGDLLISDDLIKMGADRLGIPFDQAKALAQQYLGGGAAGGRGSVDPVDLAISKLATGAKLTDQEKGAALMSFIGDLRKGPAAPSGGGQTSGPNGWV
jgi:hypothetical protein